MVDQVREFFGTEVAGDGQCQHRRIESMILLLPDPFGPDITVNPSKNGIFVFFEKDLKLSISSSVICKDPAPYFFDESVLSSSAA